MEAGEELHLLLVRAGTFKVALESLQVRVVAAAAQKGARAVSMAALLRSASPQVQGHGRLLSLRDGTAALVHVDEVLRLLRVAPRQVQRLSPLLWAHGVPTWLLGSLWCDEELVLIADVAAAMRGARSEVAHDG